MVAVFVNQSGFVVGIGSAYVNFFPETAVVGFVGAGPLHINGIRVVSMGGQPTMGAGDVVVNISSGRITSSGKPASVEKDICAIVAYCARGPCVIAFCALTLECFNQCT